MMNGPSATASFYKPAVTKEQLNTMLSEDGNVNEQSESQFFN